MADDKRTDKAKEVVASVEEEIKRVQDAAVEAREEAGHDEGETEEEYRERIANVPGIFGDIDTTAGAGASGIDVVSANNEQATVEVAEAVASEEAGNEEAGDLSVDQARRQSDIAGDKQPSAEEVDAAATDRPEDVQAVEIIEPKDDEKDEKKTTTRRGHKR